MRFVYTTLNIPTFCQYYVLSYYMISDTQKEIVQNQYDCIGGKRKANDWENLIANWHVYLLIQRKRSRCYCIPVSIALVRLVANAIILHKLKKFAKTDHYNVIEKGNWYSTILSLYKCNISTLWKGIFFIFILRKHYTIAPISRQ